jgi:hypothetical protein
MISQIAFACLRALRRNHRRKEGSATLTREGQLLATHTGELPAQFLALAALIGFGLLADAEALRDRTWW